MSALVDVAAALSPTEALLSCAAAVDRSEMQAARLALIATAAGAMRDLDRSLVIAGDGTAGRVLLSGVRPSPWSTHVSCAIRSLQLETRMVSGASTGGVS